jgi:hypothetical protein
VRQEYRTGAGASCTLRARAPVSCGNSISGQSGGCLVEQIPLSGSASVGLSIPRFRLIGTRTAPVQGCSAVGQDPCVPAAHDLGPLPELIRVATLTVTPAALESLAITPASPRSGLGLGERLRCGLIGERKRVAGDCR